MENATKVRFFRIKKNKKILFGKKKFLGFFSAFEKLDFFEEYFRQRDPSICSLPKLNLKNIDFNEFFSFEIQTSTSNVEQK